MVLQHMLSINRNGVPNTVLVDQAAPTPAISKYASERKERNDSEGQRVNIENRHQAPECDVRESKRIGIDKRHTISITLAIVHEST